MADIRLDTVTKRFGDFTAVDRVSIDFRENSVTCLLGPSGCGKTTLMRIIAGLEAPTHGRVLFGDRDVTALPPRKRDIGMVFQYPVMYPTLTAAENVALPLQHMREVDAAERARRVDEVLEILGLSDRRNALIDELDSGSRQKVAVGRAIARQCEIVLFDEPTTNVEVNAKLQLIRAFKEISRRLEQTIVYVTHDQTEAMTLADRIALMNDGVIQQAEGPRQLYNHPQTRFGGWFLGNPGMTFAEVDVEPGQRAARLPFVADPVPLPTTAATRLTVGVRPEQLRLHQSPAPGTVPARIVERSIGIAGQYLIKLAVGPDETLVKAKVPAAEGRRLTDPVHLECRPERLAFFADGVRVEAPSDSPRAEAPSKTGS
jgi:ABC-type sugar transport system ATPase subunit